MEKRKIEQVEEVPVFQACMALALSIEKNSRAFAPDFKWLRSQMLRSSESVCANMTKGFTPNTARNTFRLCIGAVVRDKKR